MAVPVTPSPSLVKGTSTVTTSSKTTKRIFTSTEVIKPTTTMVAIIEKLVTTTHQSQESVPRSSSRSSSRPHSVSVTTVSHTQRSPSSTIVSHTRRSPSSTIESPSLKTTKPSSKTYENSAISAGQHGTMKLFRFILSFHIIREGMCTCTKSTVYLTIVAPS